MIKHQMRITVRRPGEEPISITEFNKLTWMKKLALKWFGGVEKLVVIVPEKSVKSVEIKEEENNETVQDANQGEAI